MKTRALVLTAIMAVLFSIAAFAQAPSAAKKGPDPGVTPARQMDRPEVRITRVEIATGATRSVHTHDDVQFHLFIPVSGNIELTIASAKPVAVPPGQAMFMEKGTPHGFRNVGNTPGVIMEVFVKPTGTVAEKDALGTALAALGSLRDAPIDRTKKNRLN
jgi:quercetin dioxygenase-like cupin family protein